MQLRFRKDGKDIETAHTLNGSGLALPRVVAAIIEHYQEENGKIRVPKVLKPFFNREYL